MKNYIVLFLSSISFIQGFSNDISLVKQSDIRKEKINDYDIVSNKWEICDINNECRNASLNEYIEHDRKRLMEYHIKNRK